MLIALDISTRFTGVAFGGIQSPAPRCLTWELPGCSTDEKLTRSCGGLYNSIAELSKLIHPEIILFEAPFNPQAKEKGETTHQTVVNLFRMEAVARAAAKNSSARLIGPVHTQTWRKHFTGHGRPENPKEATQARCRLLGWKYANEHEADAAGIWCHGMSLHFPKWAPNGTPLLRGAAIA